MSAASNYGLSYAPLNAAKLQEILPRLQAATDISTACVIGNWMGGAPSKSMLGNYGQVLKSLDWKDGIVTMLTGGTWVIWKLGAGAAGLTLGGGKIWTIEDSCPGGPTLSEALATLFTASQFKGTDPQLWNEVMGLGQAHREHLAQQQEIEDGKQMQAMAEYVATGIKDVAAPVGSLLGILGFVTRNALPIAVGVGGVYLYLQWRKARLLR